MNRITDAFALAGVGNSNTMEFNFRLVLQDPSTNLWTMTATGQDVSSNATRTGAGYKPLSGTLDRLKVQLNAGENIATNNGIGIKYR